MGFGRRIGRAFRRVTRAVRRVTSFAKGVIKTVTKPITDTIKAFTGLAGQVLDQLPFGRAIKGFIGQFLNNPLALLAMPVLGGMAALTLGAQSFGQLLGMTQNAHQMAAFQNPYGRQNMMHMMAHRQAQMMAHHSQHHHGHIC